MRVTLTEDVVGLGDIGEQVNVKPGYARNFLIPRGLAFEADSKSARETTHRMKQVEAKKRRFKGVAEQNAQKLREVQIVMELRVGGPGKVFGSIGTRDIQQSLLQLGYQFDRRRILLSEPIKKLGAHQVRIRLHQDVETEVTVLVNPREASNEEEQQEVDLARQAIEQRAAELEDQNDDDDELVE